MIQKQQYGSTPEGQRIDRFVLTNRHGLKASLTNFGAILTGMEVPDRHGARADVTLGYDTLEGWIADKAYLGVTVGRFANRIAHGRFTLDGRAYQLAINDGPNHLHGGRKGFHKFVWETVDARETAVEFRRISPDGEEGYPGTLTAAVRYALTEDNELRVEFRATTDKPTLVNLAHHSYWNLTGDPRRTILDHELTLYADQYLPVGPSLIPTGERAAVAGTPMDFRNATAVGRRIAEAPGGYDHCWVVRGAGGTVRPAAKLRDPTSGRVMEIATNQPGIQFYSGNFLDGSIRGKGGVAYQYRCGLCLETQCWPDAPNQPGFPSAVLRPGETYSHTMAHRFGVE